MRSELSRVVCSAVVLGCLLTRCDRVEIPVPTALSPTHNHLTHPPTHSSPSPTLWSRAYIPLAVSCHRRASSAWKQNRKPDEWPSFSFSPHPKKGPPSPPLAFPAHRHHHAGSEHASLIWFQMGCIMQSPHYATVHSHALIPGALKNLLPFSSFCSASSCCSVNSPNDEPR